MQSQEPLHIMQRNFRALLGAFARPGTVGRIEALPLRRALPQTLDCTLFTLAALLADQAVSLAACGPQARELEAFLAQETRVRICPLSDAQFVFVAAGAGAQEGARAIAQARAGELISPELGATVLVGCGQLGAQPAAGLAAFEVQGPGVRPGSPARFWACDSTWLEARNSRGDEYPCGIDLVLADGEGRVVALPRTSRVREVG